MRRFFVNQRPVGLVAVGILLLLFATLATLGGRALLTRAAEQPAAVTTPYTAQAGSTSPLQEPTVRQDPEEETANEKAEKKEAEKAAAVKKAAEEEAARTTAERAAQEQYAAEQAAAEQAAAEEAAAAEQYAAEESWREAAAEREEPVAEESVGTEQASPEQPVAPSSGALSLTVPGAGIYNAPVVDSVAESVLAQGAGKMPGTGFPWQPGANTYIAGHVYGYEGTGSWQLFAGLPNVGPGSEILLTDANGTTYTYQVTETLVVAPTDVWVADSIPGQTTVSLQTCTGPGWSERMIVRGVLV